MVSGKFRVSEIFVPISKSRRSFEWVSKSRFLVSLCVSDSRIFARADPGFWNGGWIVVIFGVNFWQCVCGLKMNKLIGRTSHRLCTFSTSIREIKYYFDIWGIKKKKERRELRKRGVGDGGENSPISPPLDPRLFWPRGLGVWDFCFFAQRFRSKPW